MHLQMGAVEGCDEDGLSAARMKRGWQCSASPKAPQLWVSVQLMCDIKKAKGAFTCTDTHGTMTGAATERGRGGLREAQTRFKTNDQTKL